MKKSISLLFLLLVLCGCADRQPEEWSEDGVSPRTEWTPTSGDVSPGEKLFVAHFWGKYDLSIIDLASRKIEVLVSFRDTNAICVSANPLRQEVYVSVANGGRFYIVDVLLGEVSAFREEVEWNSWNSVISPGGELVYLATSGGYRRAAPKNKILVIDTGSRQLRNVITLGPYDFRGGHSVELSSDGQKIYAIDSTSDKLFVIQAQTGSIEQQIARPGTKILGIDPGGEALYVSGDKGVSRLNIDDWTETWNISLQSHAAAVSLDHIGVLSDGKVLLLEISSGKTLLEWDIRSPSDIIFSLDQSRIYVTSARADVVHVLDIGSGEMVDSVNLVEGSRPSSVATMMVGAR